MTPRSVRRPRWAHPSEIALLAAVTVAPLFLAGRGSLNADTKHGLYLDPVELLSRSRWMWDGRVGGGTVAHQAIGYLWPMGPYYAATEALGLPDWVAQRLWVGGLSLVAALGALALFRHLLPRSWTQVVAAGAYGLSPFVLGQVTTQSGLLVPYAGLGWLVLLMARALESPSSWRWPAAFALVVTTCGSLNGTSVLFVVAGAALWVPFAVARHEAARGDGIRVLVRAGALTLLTQVWWIVGYAVSGAFGLPVLDLTETVSTTNATTSAFEVVRGLGYWTFYGSDTEGLWLREIAPPYLTGPILIVVTFGVPVLALLAGAVVRWRPRAYFAALVGIGAIAAVGAFPPADPSPVGGAFEALSRRSEAVLSLRNTQRAGSLVALGLAGLAAGGLVALRERSRRTAGAAALAVALLAVAAVPARWTTGLVSERFHRDAVPEVWHEAGAFLDDGEGPVLELPGIDFAAYRWGHTSDPVSLGVTDRPVLGRELVPTGNGVRADLLGALDRSLQEGWFEPAALAPVARLLGTADVLVRNDLEYERYRTVRPSVAWPLLSAAPGLELSATFGAGYRNAAGPRRPMLDEIELGLPVASPEHPQLAVLSPPGDGWQELRTMPADAAIVIDGDGEGIVSAAAAGLLDDRGVPLLLAADLLGPDPALTVPAGAPVILTDSHRKRAQRWYSLRENVGATEPADGEVVLDDPHDARIPLTADVPDGTRTVIEWQGVERIWASSYGNEVTLVPEERPSNAFDGDLSTAWRTERAVDGSRRRIGVALDAPSTAGSVTLVQPQGRLGTVRITRAEVLLDGTRRFPVEIDEAGALDPAGTTVRLDGAPFTDLEVRVLDAVPPAGLAGFAEIAIPGVEVDEVTVLPTALVRALGTDLSEHPVSIVLTRLRANPAEPLRADPEPSMHRRWDLPVPLEVAVTGTARLDPSAADDVLDALLGADVARWPVRATSSERLEGSIDARASSALDRDPATAWQTPLSRVTGQWLEVELQDPVVRDRIAVEVVADGRHSLPRELLVSVDGAPPVPLAVGALDEGPPGSTQRVELVPPAPLTGRTWRFTVGEIDHRSTVDWHTGLPFTLPVALAEVELGAPARPSGPVDTGCREDLLELDGAATPVQVTGDPGPAGRDELSIVACSPVQRLDGAGELRTAPGRDTGVSLDRIVLSHDGSGAPPAPSDVPPVTVTSVRPGRATGVVDADGSPFWLVLEQSANPGWDLRVEGATVSRQHVVDGGQAAWLVRPGAPGRVEVVAEFRPQRLATAALAVSAVGVLLCLGLLVGSRRRPARTAIASRPELVLARDRWSWTAVVLAVVLSALFVSWPAAVAAAAIAAAGRRWPWIPRVAPAALVGVGAGHVLVSQVLDRWPADFLWPTRFDWSHEVTLLGLVILLVGALPDARQPWATVDAR